MSDSNMVQAPPPTHPPLLIDLYLLDVSQPHGAYTGHMSHTGHEPHKSHRVHESLRAHTCTCSIQRHFLNCISSYFPAGIHSNTIGGPGVFVPHSPVHARTSSFGSNPQLYIPPPTAPGQSQQVMIDKKKESAILNSDLKRLK